MPPAPSPADDNDRLTSFQACEILDRSPPPRFAAYAQLAAHTLSAPIAIITTMTEDGLRIEATEGLDAQAAMAAGAFVAQLATVANWPLVIEDMSIDRRFAAERLVAGPVAARSCVTVPITDSDNTLLGLICVLDQQPRRVVSRHVARLDDLAAGLAANIELRRHVLLLCESALHCAVTGLSNRTLLEHRLDAAIGQAMRGLDLAVLCVSIDRLQAVNEMFGHAAGDHLLREAAGRLQQAVPEAALISRIGAEEFALLLTGGVNASQAADVADRVMAALAEPLIISGQSLQMQAAVGFALYPEDGDTPTLLLQRAKASLQEAARDGGGSPRRFEVSIERESAEREGLEQDLRQALEQDQLYLHWQPIADALTRQTIGYEALLRWDRPGHGPVPPGQFITAAEACGLSGVLDAWVLRRACREAAAWPDTSLRAAVNVSANRVRFGDLSDSVAAALEASRLAPNRLEIEITERVLMEDENAVRGALEALRALGARIALDDFGTGFSSIGYLRTLPLDKLKLDRSFTRDLVTDPRAREVARTVVRLGRVLGLIVLAEGVETEDQLSCLRVMGCDEVQGYLLGWPRPIVPEPDAVAKGPRVSALRAAVE